MTGARRLLESLAKRKKAFFRLFALLVLNAVVLLAVTQRLANKQERLGRELGRLQLELSEKTAELEELTAAEARLERNAAAVSEFWSDVVKPRVPGLTDAWAEIDRLAKDTRVTKGRTGYSRDVLDVGLEEIRAMMPVEGSYFDLVRFINRLERSERFFLVEEIRLSQAKDDDTIRLDCEIVFYLRPGEAPVKEAEEAGP